MWVTVPQLGASIPFWNPCRTSWSLLQATYAPWPTKAVIGHLCVCVCGQNSAGFNSITRLWGGSRLLLLVFTQHFKEHRVTFAQQVFPLTFKLQLMSGFFCYLVHENRKPSRVHILQVFFSFIINSLVILANVLSCPACRFGGFMDCNFT